MYRQHVRTKIRKRTKKDGKSSYTAIYVLPDGRELSAGTFSARHVAVRAASEAAAAAATPAWVDPKSGKVTLREFAENVYFPALPVEPSTLRTYRADYRNYVLPYFGEKPLNEIKKSDVRAWVVVLRDHRGLSPSTIRKAHVKLSGIFKAAIDDGILPAPAPTEGTKLPTVPQLPVRAMSAGHVDAVASLLVGSVRVMFLTGVYTGLRVNELRGLAPCQIDWDRGTIRVDRGVVLLSRAASGIRWHFKPYPKNRKPRTIKVPVHVLQMLREEVQRKGLALQDERIIFGQANPQTDQWEPCGDKYLIKPLHAACDALGIPRWNPKDLRSTHATLLSAGGSTLMAVKDRLGHASVATTQKYLAATDDAEDRNLEALERMLPLGRTPVMALPALTQAVNG